MRLTLDAMQRVVKQAIDDERDVTLLRTEVARVLGPSVLVEGKVERIAAEANDRIDILERTGRATRLDFRPAIVARFLDHSNPEVRKFAARVVPERFLGRLTNDRNPNVRAAVARRAPIGAVREMLKRFPKDDLVRVIYKQKRLAEAGITQPTSEPLGHDPTEDAERLGDAAKQDEGAELSEQWYRDRAFNFMQDYGGNIEYCWEELAARRYAASVKATSGVEVDELKLLGAIKDLIKEKEDHALKRDALKETLGWLKGREERELMSEAAMPIISEESDPVRDLLEGSLTPQGFIDEANTLFRVQEATVPAAHRKHRLGERNVRSTSVPVIGRLPHGRGFRALDERALDAYCRFWNDRQQLQGEPLRLEWSTHPDQVGKISFNVVLR